MSCIGLLTCEECNGAGGWYESFSRELEEYFDWEQCGICDGTGETDE